jgi:hypothetical protein
MRWIAGVLFPFVAGCAVMDMGPFPRTIIPAEIAAPASQRLELVAAGTGVQVYRCDAKADVPGQFDWTYQASEGWLRDTAGKSVGRYYAGPTWEADDGSKTIGSVVAQSTAPERSAIPWQRLGAKSSGTGILSKVGTVLRVSTTGGRAPAAGCNTESRGRIVRVEYSADYYFYVPR